MRRLMVAMWMAVAGSGAAAAEIVTVPAQGSVAEVMNRLVVAVEGAGALVFARVDHAGAAAIVGERLAPMELLVFGNPKLGTPALQDAPLAGLMLPLRVLAYEDGAGQVVLAYEAPGAMLAGVGGQADAPHVAQIAAALERLTAAAARP